MVNSQNQSMPEAEFTGRYLVIFREGAIAEGIQMLSEMTNMSFSSTEQTQADSPIFLENLGIAIVNVNPEQINSLRVATQENSPILAIEPERVVYAISGNIVDNLIPVEQTTANASFDESSITWGLQATNVIGAFPSGQGIRIAVLDTGLDFNHPDFQGRVINSNSFVQGQGVQDGHGHGTHCIGTACGPQKPEILPRYGIAYNCEIYVGKVLSNEGFGGDAGILQGIEWAVANGCHVISMSLGADVGVGDPFSVVYETAAQRALNQGTLIVAAAGNSGPQNPVNHPANCPSIMAIAAVDSQLQVADFSCRGINPNGGEINIAAPGVAVYSTVLMPERYATWNGTSMATPHVAGIAALYAEITGLRGKALWNHLLQTVRPLPLPSKDVGAGLVQFSGSLPGAGIFQIKSKYSGKCLDLSLADGPDTVNGTNVFQWDCHGGDNQKWILTPQPDGSYKINSKYSGKCLDLSLADGPDTVNGTNVFQWDCHGGDNQKWFIIR